MAMEAPAETLAYVILLNAAKDGRPDALGVVDVDPSSSTYGTLIDKVDERFFVDTESVGLRPHQIHLEGGDASSDSYCFP